MEFYMLALVPVLTLALPSVATTVHIDVTSLGAIPDGKSNSTDAFLAAWDLACSSSTPATIYVPPGEYYVGKVVFRGPCRHQAMLLSMDGVLVAPNHYDLGTNWLVFNHVRGFTIEGGALDAQGASLWSCKNAGHRHCPRGATSLEFASSRDIKIRSICLRNSQKFHIAIFSCKNVDIDGLQISADANSPNTDGIHVEESKSVGITNSRISTGDDCVSIGPGSEHVWLENITCGPGHGISIGSLGWDWDERGVRNVTVTKAVLTDTTNGLRIKTWGKKSNSYVKNILFQHILIDNSENPILIDQNYCPDDNCPQGESGVKVSKVKYEYIYGSSASKVAVKFDCSKLKPCSGITLKDVHLTYNNEPAKALCSNANGKASGVVLQTSCL